MGGKISKEKMRIAADKRNKKLRELEKYGKQTLQKPRVYGNKLNSAAAAEYLGVSEGTLKTMRANRMVSYIRYGKEYRYLVADLEKCIQDHRVPAVEFAQPNPGMLLA